MIKFKTKIVLAMREMTQKELAELTGVRLPTISALCTGTAKHIPVDVLDKICFVLGCQPADLIEYIEEAPKELAPPAKEPVADFSNLPPELLSALQDFIQKQNKTS